MTSISIFTLTSNFLFLGRFQLKILRQLVELQLTHSQEIKATIDRAWGVVHHKHKKERGVSAAGGSATAGLERDRDFLGFQPYGYDAKRTRYWVIDSACFLCMCGGIHVGISRLVSSFIFWS